MVATTRTHVIRLGLMEGADANVPSKGLKFQNFVTTRIPALERLPFRSIDSS